MMIKHNDYDSQKIINEQMPENERIAAMYDSSWKIEVSINDKSMSPYNVHLAQYYRVVSELALKYSPKARTIVDYGTGNGKVVDELICHYGMQVKILAFDISQVAVDFMNDKWKNHALVSAEKINKTEIPLEDGSVDIITACEVFEHLYDPDAFLLEISRVLKNRGKLILTTPNFFSESFFFIPKLFPKSIRKKLHAKHDRWQSPDEKWAKVKLEHIGDEYKDIKSHVRTYTPWELKKIVSRYKEFKIRQIKGISFYAPFPSLFNKVIFYRWLIQAIDWIVRRLPILNIWLLKTTIVVIEKSI